jgi:hypothetical protein
MVKFVENHRALDAVVKGAVSLRSANPGKPSVIDVFFDFIHFHSCMATVHVGGGELYPFTKATAGRVSEVVCANARVVEHDVVFEGLSQIVVAGFREIQNGFLPLWIG